MLANYRPFSEDIDLAIDREFLGFAGDNKTREIGKKLRKHRVHLSGMSLRLILNDLF